MHTNPYVGPRSFTTGERLYGRDRELRKLANLLIAERVVLLYSPSGAGKTSLAQAALVPRLREEGFQVLPTVRVGAEPPAELPGANRYVLATLLSLEGGWPAAEQIPLAELAGLSLADYLGRRADREADGTVLILDQFEEVLSVVPNDRAAKEAFFEQLGEALRPRERWALFSMREDYIAQLDPFLRAIPTRLANRFRLDLLEAEAALAAIQAPARAAGVTFSAEAAQRLIDDLRMVRVQHADGAAAQEPGLYIEPVQLQVVCYRLWEQLPEGVREISLADVARAGDVTTALRSYYAERVGAAAAAADVGERLVRDWFDGRLITAQGIRAQVLQERGASGGLDNRAIARLVDAHLVRGEQIRGATWYELAHDRLIEPVQADNAAWRAEHLSQLQRQAALWEAEGRQDGLLLRGDELAAAEAWAAERQAELTEVERAFLERCRQVREVARRDRRNFVLIRALAVAASVVSVIAAALAVLAFQAKGEADQQARSALVRSLASAALADNAVRPQRDLLMALEAQRIGADKAMIQGEEAIQQLLTEVGGQPRQLDSSPSVAALSADSSLLALADTDSAGAQQIQVVRLGEQGNTARLAAPAPAGVEQLTLSPDGSLLAIVARGGSLSLWQTGGPQAAPVALAGAEGAYSAAAFSADGALLAAGGAGGSVQIWRADSPGAAPERVTGDSAPIAALALSPDGARLAIGYQDGHAGIWPRDGGAPRPLPPHVEPVTRMVFSPDGSLVVSGAADGTVLVSRIVDAQQDRGFRTFSGHSSSITGLRFSPDGRTVASSSRDGTAQLWAPLDDGAAPLVLRGHEGWLLDVSFSADGAQVATVGRDGMERRWDVGRPTSTAVLRKHSREVAAVAYSPDGRWLATGSIDKDVGLWAVDGDRASLSATLTTTSSLWWVAFSPDSSLLAAAAEDGQLRVWRVAAPDQPPTAIAAHAGIATALAFSPDGSQLASVGFDGALKLWKLAQPETPQVLISQGEPLRAVAFSEDGAWLAAAGDDSLIRVWDYSNLAAAPVELSGHEGAVFALAFRPDHPAQLAAAGFDAGVYLWDIKSPAQPTRFSGHTDWIIGLAFSPDGDTLASGGNDDTVRLWRPDQAGGAPLLLRAHRADVEAVAFSPDGRWLASGSLDATAIIWPMQLDTLKARACAVAGRNMGWEEWQPIAEQMGVLYRRSCRDLPANQDVIDRAAELAQKGRQGDALALLRAVAADNPELGLNPEQELRRSR